MFSSPVFYVWIAWLLALAVFAVVRYKARQHEEHQREERRQQREAERADRGQRSGVGVRRQLSRPSLSADYRDQLVAAGLIRPAADPDTTADPATSM
jgi:heme exporter protein D